MPAAPGAEDSGSDSRANSANSGSGYSGETLVSKSNVVERHDLVIQCGQTRRCAGLVSAAVPWAGRQ